MVLLSLFADSIPVFWEYYEKFLEKRHLKYKT